MRLVRFQRGGKASYGRLEGGFVVPVSGERLEDALTGQAVGDPVALSEVRLLATVARPGKMPGIAVNSAPHSDESVTFGHTA